MLKLKTILLLMSVLMSLPIFAQERGTPIFQDSFDTKDTFAENWVVGKGWNGRIHSIDGQVVFPQGGSLMMRRDTPADFYVEMDITVNSLSENASVKRGFCGFIIEGFRFTITNEGNYWVASSPKESGGTGLSGKIEGFRFGKPVRVSLTRKAKAGTAKYIFDVNGKEAATRVFNLHKDSEGKYKSLNIFSYGIDMSIDNFGIFMIKQSADDSPNLIFNSGFEYELDGFPPYYTTPSFNAKNINQIPYEKFLASVSLDDTEKHSGKYSLKLVNDGRTKGGQQSVRPWGVGTVKNGSGVFSVWMKTDQEALPVKLNYGGKSGVKIVEVGNKWKRYEVVNTNLPKPGVYSPVSISFKDEGTLWVDDLQAEFISAPTEEELKSTRTFATPYKPSELDKSRFGKQDKKAPVRTPEIIVSKLPEGIIPGTDLDSWKQHAVMRDKFYYGEKSPEIKTEAYFACDDKNLYIGFRSYVNDLEKVDPKRDIAEVLVEPIISGKKFMQFQFYAYADGTIEDKGLGMDAIWDGNWKSTVELNDKTSSIDTTIAIPFSDFAHPEMKTSWIMNLHRYDSATKEVVTLIQCPNPSFANPQLWPFVTFPEEVIKPYIIGVGGGGYSDSSVTLDIGNNTGKDRKVTVTLTAGEITQKKDVTLKKGANSVSFPAQLKDPKVAVKLTESGDMLCNQICILEKRDPISMLGRLSFYMEEDEAPFRVTTSVMNPEKLTAVLTCGDVSVKQPAAAKFQIALPLKDIVEGTHTATLVLVDDDGKKIAETSSTLIKRPFKDGAAQVNHFSRSLMHDGEPVVPFAPFFVVYGKWGMNEEALDGYASLLEKYGFRYVHILFQSYENMEKENALTRYFLEATNKKGIKVILWSKYYAYTDEACAITRKELDLPNVVTQMVLDEPELSQTSDWSRDFLRKMRAFFPYHPTQMNNTVLGVPARHGNLETDILMLDDYLTNNENRTVLSVVQHADVMWEAGAPDGKPCWYFIVGNNTSLHYREPTYAEQIAQTYGNIATGVTGFSLFYGWPGTPGNWKAYLQLNKEIIALTDVLTSEEEIAQSSATGDPKLMRHITKKHNEHLYVVSCNIDENPAGKIEFTLPAELKYDSKAEVMFENRKLKVKNGKFTDDFDGHSRHVYKVQLK